MLNLDDPNKNLLRKKSQRIYSIPIPFHVEGFVCVYWVLSLVAGQVIREVFQGSMKLKLKLDTPQRCHRAWLYLYTNKAKQILLVIHKQGLLNETVSSILDCM